MTFSIQVSARTLIRRRILSIIHHCFAPCPLALAAGVLFAAASLCPAAAATTYSYTGGGAGTASAPVTGNFSTGFNTGVVGSTASDTLSFGGSSYTATDDLTQQILANMLTFTNTGALTLARGGTGTSNSISLGGTSPSISVNGAGTTAINLDLVLTANTTFAGTASSGRMTIAGIISGAGSLATANNGPNLNLQGANTYSGGTTIGTGTLIQLNAAGATLGTGAVTDNGMLSLSANGLNISNAISGTGSVGLFGSSNVITLSGSNSFTGAVATNANTLKLGNANALGNSSGVTIASNGILDLNGQTVGTSPAIVSIAGTLTNGNTTAATFGGNIGGATGFTVNGVSAINLSGAVILTSGTVSVNGTNTLTLSGIADNGTTGFATSNNSTIILSKASTAAIHAVGTNGMIIGGGTVQLAGTGSDQIADSATISLDYSTLDLNGRNETVGDLFSSGSTGVITNTASGSNSTLTVGGQNTGGNTFSGSIKDGNGTVSIIKTGTGAITFSGTGTYTGGTTVTGGTLNAKATNSLGTGPLAVNNANAGAGVNVIVNFSANQTVSSLSSTVAQPASGTNTAQITIASGATLADSQSGTTSYAGLVSGSGTLSIAGQSSTSPATLNYTGTDSAAQTNVGANANLQLNNASGAALSGPVAVATSGTLTINPNATNNEIATATPLSTAPTTAAVTLNGGTLSANGSDGAVDTPTSLATAKVTASMGALALGANGTSANPSVLAFAAGTASQPFVLAFADSTKTLGIGSGYLNITGYTGTTNALYIGTTADLSPTQLALLSFNGLKAGQLTNGEIVALAAAPEPSGWLTLLVGAAALGGLAQARRRKANNAAMAA